MYVAASEVLPGLAGHELAYASALNDFGDAVGVSANVATQELLGTLWHRGAAYDLNELIDDDDPLKPCLTLTHGVAINERGEIASATTAKNLIEPSTCTSSICFRAALAFAHPDEIESSRS